MCLYEKASSKLHLIFLLISLLAHIVVCSPAINFVYRHMKSRLIQYVPFDVEAGSENSRTTAVGLNKSENQRCKDVPPFLNRVVFEFEIGKKF